MVEWIFDIILLDSVEKNEKKMGKKLMNRIGS